MRKESEFSLLLGLQGLAVVATFILVVQYLRHSRTASYHSDIAATHQKNSAAFQLIVNESVQYLMKNPSIEPVLNSIGVRVTATQTVAPAAPANPAPRR
jgi:hypothetical protein